LSSSPQTVKARTGTPIRTAQNQAQNRVMR
jgi:hypothetical protein